MSAARATGKGPPEIVASIVGNLRSFWQLRAERDEAEGEGLVWWTSGGHRRPLNGVLALTAADPGPAADRIAATFRLSGLPCSWLEGPDPPSPALGLRLLGLGYRPLEGSVGWALPLAEANQAVRGPSGLLYRHGRQTDLVDALAHLAGVGGLHLEGGETAPLAALLRPRDYRGEQNEEVWLALHDGVPVSGLLAHRFDSAVGIFALSTEPELRGQGVATALVLTAIRAAQADGLAWAVAESPEAHAGPFRRLGFTEYCDFRRYGWEPHPAPTGGA